MASVGIKVALVLAGFCAVSAEARPASPFISMGPLADGPAGFYELCRRDLAACLGRPASEASIAAVERLQGSSTLGSTSAIPPSSIDYSSRAETRAGHLKQLARFNRQVNRQIRQRTDAEIYGVEEHWARPGKARAGDCEDIAIEKRALLSAAGVAPDRLFLGVVFRRGVGLHTVLIVRLERGDYVLDSLRSRVLRWNEADYTWLRVQSPDDPLSWRRIG